PPCSSTVSAPRGSAVRIAAPPLRSALLPYTTVFRSDQRLPVVELRRVGHRSSTLPLGRALLGEGGDALGCVLGQEAPAPVEGSIDRKSTRLNSSHQIISYAVFCLKKKKEELARQHAL